MDKSNKPQPACRTTRGAGSSKVADLVCWRSLEGRRCIPRSQLLEGSSLDVVVVPIRPKESSSNNSKPAAVGHHTTSQQQPDIEPSGGESNTSPCSDLCNAPPCAGGQELTSYTTQLKEAVAAAGLRCLIDAAADRTPGQKYHYWEQVGTMAAAGRHSMSTVVALIIISFMQQCSVHQCLTPHCSKLDCLSNSPCGASSIVWQMLSLVWQFSISAYLLAIYPVQLYCTNAIPVSQH